MIAKNRAIKKVLVIRFSSIGDIVLTTPVVRCLKRQMPGLILHFCTKTQYRDLVENNPYIDKVHLLKDSINELTGELKKEKFDFVVDLHSNIRTWFIKKSIKSSSSTYDKLRFQRQLLAMFPLPLPKPSHVVHRYMDAVGDLGVNYDGEGLDYFIHEKDEIEKDWLPISHQKGYIAFAIGGTAFTKMLPLSKMIELCDKINKPIILIGDKGDYETGEQIANFFNHSPDDEYKDGLKALGKKTTIFNACGKFNLGQSAYLVKHADAVFSHDTGFAHISAAFKKKVYSIWGGTVPLYFYPFETRFTILENKDLKCRPCSKNGRSSCPKKHFKCMNENPLDF